MNSQEERRLLHLFETVETESEKSSISEDIDSDADPEYIVESDVSCGEESESNNEELDDRQQPVPVNVSICDNWQVPDWLRLKNITYNPDSEEVGINPDLIETMSSARPYDFFCLFLDDEVVTLLRSSRINSWVPTNPQEMRNFLGIILWMGLVNMPSLAHYWRNTHLYNSKLTNLMSRNRFEFLLSMFHISDNTKITPGDRLHKIQSLIGLLLNRFNRYVIPEEFMCIDESMVPFLETGEDVLAISTKHLDSMVNVTQRGGDKIKLQAIVEYNKGKSFIDVPDQMNSYNSFTRRSLKWYRKVTFDLLLNVAVVNALSLYSKVTNSKMKITEFRESIVEDMLT
ncbi:hypothetical protein NQ314_004537 [Rhamnusium bicolor]|uniref:PiggyBac transposable element-derived protein domain-containing protein n=1 Tax=Rhamnusium bicolor TaxID=1586634 RepID=A0AAV8ZLE8_9CUCU|nr:hypothetical protein NQ314_004537 [Rhamnusium bicolor]